MDLRQLQYIVAIVEAKSVSKAAETLHISQPSLSHALLKTEKELGVELFNRSSYPLQLTYAGEKYLEVAYETLRLHRAFEKECQDMAHGAKGRIRVGFPRERAAQVLPVLLPAFHRRLPGVEVQVGSNSADAMLNDVCKGDLDFCILPELGDRENFRYEKLFQEELYVVAAQGVVADSFRNRDYPGVISLSAFESFPLIAPSRNSGLAMVIKRFFENRRIKPKIAMELKGNQACYLMAAAGQGLAVIPRLTIDLTRCGKEPELFSLSPGGTGWNVCAVFHRESCLSEAEIVFLKTIRELFDVPRALQLTPIL